jgi:RecB family exonuclease
MLTRFRRHPVFREIGQRQKPYCELPFLASFGAEGGKGFYLEGKIDLLYLGREGWEVLDYKTGASDRAVEDGDPEGGPFRGAGPSAGGAHLAYAVQLAAYCLAAERLLGARPSGATLFFLELDENPCLRIPVTLEYMTESYNQIAHLVESIRAGRFKAREAGPREGCRCDYEWACSKAQERSPSSPS